MKDFHSNKFPYAGARPDATSEIEKLTVEEMFDFSDDFFRSLGMIPGRYKISIIKSYNPNFITSHD